MGDRCLRSLYGSVPGRPADAPRASTLKQAFETYVYALPLSSAQTDRPVTREGTGQSAAFAGIDRDK